MSFDKVKREVMKKQRQVEIEKKSQIPGVKEGMSSARNQIDCAWLKCQKAGSGAAGENRGVRAESGGDCAVDTERSYPAASSSMSPQLERSACPALNPSGDWSIGPCEWPGHTDPFQ